MKSIKEENLKFKENPPSTHMRNGETQIFTSCLAI